MLKGQIITKKDQFIKSKRKNILFHLDFDEDQPISYYLIILITVENIKKKKHQIQCLKLWLFFL
jgi:hypothetical protein